MSSRTRAVLLTSPHNPTGAVMTRDELVAVGEICRRHDLWLICDEVYAELTFGVEHVGVLSLEGIADRVVSVSSLSKSHSMTGWRAGWAIGPVELAEHLVYLSLCMLYGSPGFVQDAAQLALSTQIDEVGELFELYRQRAAAIVDEFSLLGPLRPRMPEGGMFLMLDIRSTGLTRRRVRAPAARGGGRLGAAGRGLRTERCRARPHLRDDERGAPARGLPADRPLRGSAADGRDGSGCSRTRDTQYDPFVTETAAEHGTRAIDELTGALAASRVPGGPRARDRAARRARARQAAAARGRGRRRQDRGREDARRRARRPPDPAAVLRGHRCRARALRLELRAPDARDPPDRDRRRRARGRHARRAPARSLQPRVPGAPAAARRDRARRPGAAGAADRRDRSRRRRVRGVPARAALRLPGRRSPRSARSAPSSGPS